MRKWIILFFYLIFSVINLFNTRIVNASNKYAQALESTNLYKTSIESDDISNIYCLVEKTYFVKIVADYNDYYKVEYNGITGYVKKNDVKEITNTPFTPYPYNIKITLDSACNLRSSPTVKSQHNNIITTLSSGESNFTFIGRIYSDEAIDFGGTTWYYVNYNGEYGYIYNKYVKSITPIYENTEEVTYKNSTSEPLVNPITNTPTIIIIALLFIPCIIILLILYLPRKNKLKKIKQVEEIYKY